PATYSAVMNAVTHESAPLDRTTNALSTVDSSGGSVSARLANVSTPPLFPVPPVVPSQMPPSLMAAAVVPVAFCQREFATSVGPTGASPDTVTATVCVTFKPAALAVSVFAAASVL